MNAPTFIVLHRQTGPDVPTTDILVNLDQLATVHVEDATGWTCLRTHGHHEDVHITETSGETVDLIRRAGGRIPA
jgi:hypothetical protein